MRRILRFHQVLHLLRMLTISLSTVQNCRLGLLLTQRRLGLPSSSLRYIFVFARNLGNPLGVFNQRKDLIPCPPSQCAHFIRSHCKMKSRLGTLRSSAHRKNRTGAGGNDVEFSPSSTRRSLAFASKRLDFRKSGE